MDQPAPEPRHLLRSLLVGGFTPTNPLVELPLLGARLYAGWTIMKAGRDKLPVPDWMVDQVAQVGWFPAEGLFALMACLTEFAGGLLLAAGLFTRPVAVMLAFTLGVAAFGFHRVTPVTGMHITQGFFWLYLVYVGLGSGRLSIDAVLRGLMRPVSGEASPRRVWAYGAAVVLALIPTGYGLSLHWWPAPPAPAVTAEDVAVETLSVAGSFNDWDLTTDLLTALEGDAWSIQIELEPGPVEFKFAANGSWDFNLGDDDPGTAGFPVAGEGELGGGNIRAYIPNAGLYRFTVDVAQRRYRLETVAAELPEGETLDEDVAAGSAQEG